MLESDQLKAYILKCYKKGKYTLASGKESKYYFDLKQLLLNSEAGYLAARQMFRLVLGHDRETVGVAGSGVGGTVLVPLTVMCSYQAGNAYNGVIVRAEKDHGTKNKVEGLDSFERFSERVTFLEDVVSTGQSALKAIQVLQGEGLYCNKVIALLDREDGGAELLKENGIELFSFVTLSTLREMTSSGKPILFL